MPYSSGGRPVTALSPTFGMSKSRNTHRSVPSGMCSIRGAMSLYFAGTWFSKRSGGSTTWSSTLTRIMSSMRMARSLRPCPARAHPAPGAAWAARASFRPVQRPVCIVGVGLSDGPVTPDLSAVMLEAQSFRRALDDAGLEKDDIDGLASAGYGGMHEVALAEYLGLTPTWLESSSVGGSSFEFHAMHAYRAIQNGDADTIAIVYGNNQLSASGRTLGTGGGGGGGRGGVARPLPKA